MDERHGLDERPHQRRRVIFIGRAVLHQLIEKLAAPRQLCFSFIHLFFIFQKYRAVHVEKKKSLHRREPGRGVHPPFPTLFGRLGPAPVDFCVSDLY